MNATPPIGGAAAGGALMYIERGKQPSDQPAPLADHQCLVPSKCPQADDAVRVYDWAPENGVIVNPKALPYSALICKSVRNISTPGAHLSIVEIHSHSRRPDLRNGGDTRALLDPSTSTASPDALS